MVYSITIKNKDTIKELKGLKESLGLTSFKELINFLIKFFKDNNQNKKGVV